MGPCVSMGGPDKVGGKEVSTERRGGFWLKLIQVSMFRVSIMWWTKLRMNSLCSGDP